MRFFVLGLLALSGLSGFASAESSCAHESTPNLSRCSGCPPRYSDGKLCASTTRYTDLTKGACGCGNDPNPKSFWTKTDYTAAMNAMSLDPSNPELSWCPTNCGQCFELCSTGGTTNGNNSTSSATAGKCIVIQVENRCGDGYLQPGEAQWCRQQMSWTNCVSNPGACSSQGNTNDYGYPVHFDLQDVNGQIDALGWDNSEVTFQPVSCSAGNFGNWQSSCQCSEASSVLL
jgi:hypothetical protein